MKRREPATMNGVARAVRQVIALPRKRAARSIVRAMLSLSKIATSLTLPIQRALK